MTPNKPLAPPSARRPNSPSPLPTLGVNVVLLRPKLLLITAWYVPLQVSLVLQPPPLTKLFVLLATFGKNLLQHMTRNGSPSSLPTPPNVTPSPPVPPPSHPSLYHAVITSPDSAPGADGIPYSAWRICPRITAQALDHHFQSILTRTASPPLQSLVFIPKADQGEYADNYRPLGLPNTCDRILDRSIYSPFSHCLLGTLHPAQALLNLFREPQFNYLDIQHFLDNAMHLHSVLLSDLAKAFERVNPHWIMHVLVARATPYWILAYCRHILFGRKVLHKIKSHFRPPLAIHNGVDMGRAFSVLLFCVAMDPWYHYVHRIPRVLTNRGYMDDNATGGLGLQWLPEAQKLINRFSTAGLVVLTHSCYKIELLSSTPFTLPHYEILPHVTSGLPSLFQAYSSLPLTGIIRLRSGNRAVTLHSSSLRFGNTLTCPSHPDVLTFLHTAPCNCKCKTFLIPNHRLSPEELTYVDSTPFGCKIIAPSATMLGLFLHSPLTYVLPSLAAPYHQSPQVHHFDVAAIETQQTSNALARMTKRVQIGTRLALSFRERTIFLTFYVLSLPMYHHSILLPSTTLLTKYYGMIRSMLAPILGFKPNISRELSPISSLVSSTAHPFIYTPLSLAIAYAAMGSPLLPGYVHLLQPSRPYPGN